METYKNYINGAWQESASGETFEVRNPADADEVVSEFYISYEEDANEAVEAAAAAQDEWKHSRYFILS